MQGALPAAGETLRRAVPIVAVISVAALAAIALLAFGAEGNVKLVIALGIGALIVVGGYVAGNFRLFSLWGLILTLHLDLSLRIGTVYQKLGGETAFRIEVSDLFWGILLAYLARDLWIGAQRGVRIPKVTYVWIAIMLLGLWAVVIGPYRLTALHEVVRMFKVMLLFIVVCNELRTPARFLHVAAALMTAVLIQSCAGITQYILQAPLGLKILGESEVAMDFVTVKSAGVVRIGAFMTHPNLLAIFLATLLPLALSLLLIRTSRAMKALLVAAILLGVPTLILTLSRAGWLSFAMALAIAGLAILIQRNLRRRALLSILAAGVVMTVLAAFFAEPIWNRVFHSTSLSERGRDEWVNDALRMTAERPILGWGLNSYVFAVPPFTRLGARGARELYERAKLGSTEFVPAVHNAYLTWLAETGIVGLVLHLSLFLVLIRVGIGNLRVRNEMLYLINAACLAGVSVFLIESNFSNSLRTGAVLREFWVLAALICGTHYWRLQHERPGADAGGPPAGAMGARPAAR